jgi:hypothetical protein
MHLALLAILSDIRRAGLLRVHSELTRALATWETAPHALCRADKLVHAHYNANPTNG